jgi:excinuclease ABC subunit C
MRLPPATVIDARTGAEALDTGIDDTPNIPGAFLIHPHTGAPYLGRTAVLKRRLRRLLREREGASRFLNLRDVTGWVEYWPTGSRLEQALVCWTLGRQHFPGDYRQRLKLRLPPYVKLIRSHVFPRTQVTTRLTAGTANFYGPFRTRVAAERFEGEFLDLFQIRRCPEDFDPSPDHPGCIYGEMGRCLRPCQEVVGAGEYAGEVKRVAEFIATNGESLVRSITSARDRFSNELQFEEASRQHQHLERIRQVLKLRDDLVCDLDELTGVAITPSVSPDAVELWFMRGGCWLSPRRFELTMPEGKPVSLDSRLRELAAGLEAPQVKVSERQEHVAILARWFYSSWRDGEWLAFPEQTVPYRKLVNAIHRVAVGQR